LGIAALALSIWLILYRSRPQQGARLQTAAVLSNQVARVAVLPFENRNLDKTEEDWSEVSQDILNALAKIKGLRVPAWTSVALFTNRNEAPQTIGEKLHVDYLLRGRVRKAGKILRIDVQLMNVADGFVRWTETYDRGDEHR
jgi:serine/threonine-protein kinase